MSKTKIFLISVLLFFVSVGCANLKAVREYANESAKFSAYTDLTTRFRDTYEREGPYLSGKAAELAQENDKKRKAAYKDLLKIHQRVFIYMQTLSTLAGEDTFDLSKNIDSLSTGIKEYPDLGIQKEHVTAVSNIAKVVTKWITSSYQHNAVKKMVKEGHVDLQTTLDGMQRLVSIYKKTNENEKKNIVGLFEVEIALLDASKDKLLIAIANEKLKTIARDYETAAKKYEAAEKGIKSISEGHTEILENIEKITAKEAKELISRIAKDIKTVRKDLEAFEQ